MNAVKTTGRDDPPRETEWQVPHNTPSFLPRDAPGAISGPRGVVASRANLGPLRRSDDTVTSQNAKENHHEDISAGVPVAALAQG